MEGLHADLLGVATAYTHGTRSARRTSWTCCAGRTGVTREFIEDRTLRVYLAIARAYAALAAPCDAPGIWGVSEGSSAHPDRSAGGSPAVLTPSPACDIGRHHTAPTTRINQAKYAKSSTSFCLPLNSSYRTTARVPKARCYTMVRQAGLRNWLAPESRTIHKRAGHTTCETAADGGRWRRRMDGETAPEDARRTRRVSWRISGNLNLSNKSLINSRARRIRSCANRNRPIRRNISRCRASNRR